MMEDVEILKQTELDQRYKLLHYRVQTHRLGKIWQKFGDAGFEPILIKGWAAAQLYPQPYERQYTDIDLVFSPEEFDKAGEFLKTFAPEIPVDLHKGVRHLDSLSFEDLYKNSTFKDCDGVKIRVLREEDHLRILCIHWLNDGGADKNRLWDIYYGIDNRSPDFDWNRFLETVSRKRRRWLVCAVGLTNRYLDLQIENTPITAEAKELPNWLIKAVENEWASGVRLIPLQHVMYDKKRLWEQVKKRIPPNAVQATIEMEGSFDNVPRIFYQIADVFSRIPASISKYLKSKSALL